MKKMVLDRPLGRREVRKQERRDAIVAVACRSFLDVGYAATSMSGLLKTIGGSKETLWSYFRSKEELFAAVIEDVILSFRQQLESDLLAAGALKPALTAFCRGFMDTIAAPDAIATWRLVVAESGRLPEVGHIFYDRAVSHVERALSAYLSQKIDAGQLRDDDPGKMAQALIGMCATQQNKLLWGLAPADSDEKDADADRFAGYFIRMFAVV